MNDITTEYLLELVLNKAPIVTLHTTVVDGDMIYGAYLGHRPRTDQMYAGLSLRDVLTQIWRDIA